MKKKCLVALLVLAVAAAVARLFYAAWVDSMDFVVYWKAASVWLSGGNPYLFDAATRGFVFKYPPWILPLFLPFGAVNYDIARMAWAVLELFCLGYALRWLWEAQVGTRILILSAFLYWWIWLGHFFAGQFTLVLLAAALWAVPSKPAKGGFRVATVLFIFSAKVFSGLSLLGLGKRLLQPRVLVWTLGSVMGLTALTWGVLNWRGENISLAQLFSDWGRAATSGGAELGQRIVRGQMNHSFTAGVLRWGGVSPTATRWDALAAVSLFLVLAPVWMRVSRKLESAERWAGWLALGLVVHPLAWHHSFVLAFPLCVLALDRAWKAGRGLWIGMAAAAFICIGLLIPNIFGLTLVTPLEVISIKSWGVVLAATALVKSRSC